VVNDWKSSRTFLNVNSCEELELFHAMSYLTLQDAR
jgi:hypothetical protein